MHSRDHRWEERNARLRYIGGGGKLNDYLTCVIISHFHLDHCGSLPHMSEIVGFDGPIYMTYPTKAIAPVLLVIAVDLHETVQVDSELSIRAFYAGHVLGAAMFEIRVGHQSILYTGMLHGGQSLKVFRKWCHDPRNMIIMPGYCVAGTVGAKVISGMKKIEIEGKMLIRVCQPRSVMFVHGEAAKMEFLKGKVEKNGLEVISCEAAASRLQLGLHTITLSQLVKSRSVVDWRALSEALSIHDTHLQHKQDGIELFHGEICVLPVKGDDNQASDKNVELVWDECRESWQSTILQTIQETLSKQTTVVSN
ncbi:hypothetical protein TELCIR_13605 [Teladorsagia circumcincta]|uniref:Beta-Casp domain-containing protein n=1 Tax=Teladorsagia circumcincta TaxID=45464 RepID=A0A2G9U3J4_TELCI|nr:hypothetical protein TELCIR_13605 [Teladorsagia circumcincta]